MSTHNFNYSSIHLLQNSSNNNRIQFFLLAAKFHLTLLQMSSSRGLGTHSSLLVLFPSLLFTHHVNFLLISFQLEDCTYIDRLGLFPPSRLYHLSLCVFIWKRHKVSETLAYASIKSVLIYSKPIVSLSSITLNKSISSERVNRKKDFHQWNVNFTTIELYLGCSTVTRDSHKGTSSWLFVLTLWLHIIIIFNQSILNWGIYLCYIVEYIILILE